jgi:hypothetical protein
MSLMYTAFTAVGTLFAAVLLLLVYHVGFDRVNHYVDDGHDGLYIAQFLGPRAFEGLTMTNYALAAVSLGAVALITVLDGFLGGVVRRLADRVGVDAGVVSELNAASYDDALGRAAMGSAGVAPVVPQQPQQPS